MLTFSEPPVGARQRWLRDDKKDIFCLLILPYYQIEGMIEREKISPSFYSDLGSIEGGSENVSRGGSILISVEDQWPR